MKNLQVFEMDACSNAPHCCFEAIQRSLLEAASVSRFTVWSDQDSFILDEIISMASSGNVAIARYAMRDR